MQLLLPALMALAIGMMLPLQGLVNARLGTQIGGPIVATFVSFLIGTVLLGAYLLLTRTPLAIGGGTKLPAWIWTGGLLGALYVACFTLLMPRLGAAALVCLAILGQVTASLLFDHFGVLQAPRRADPVRIAGAILMIVGVLMVAAPWRTAVKAPADASSKGG
ncbi:MAG: DMT family transporter [Xanthomonadales bacterium]|jgi:transporter family-2 protein|nr:DMT family transporter [Xanthomonadales bacterium]